MKEVVLVISNLMDLLLKAKKYINNTLVCFDDNMRTITVSIKIHDEEVYREFKRFFEAVRMVVR